MEKNDKQVGGSSVPWKSVDPETRLTSKGPSFDDLPVCVGCTSSQWVDFK